MAKRSRAIKQISVAHPTTFDMGAMGPANRICLVVEDRPDVDVETGKAANPNKRKGVRRVPWIEAYFKSGRLTISQWNTARTLRDAAEGVVTQDSLAAIFIDRGFAQSDPQSAMVDARAAFRAMWARVPNDCRPVVSRVVLEDSPVWSGKGGAATDRHFARLQRGLDAVTP